MQIQKAEAPKLERAVLTLKCTRFGGLEVVRGLFIWEDQNIYERYSGNGIND